MITPPHRYVPVKCRMATCHGQLPVGAEWPPMTRLTREWGRPRPHVPEEAMGTGVVEVVVVVGGGCGRLRSSAENVRYLDLWFFTTKKKNNYIKAYFLHSSSNITFLLCKLVVFYPFANFKRNLKAAINKIAIKWQIRAPMFDNVVHSCT